MTAPAASATPPFLLIESVLPTKVAVPPDHVPLWVHRSTKAALVLSWGDEDGSGSPDLNVRIFSVVPLMSAALRRITHLGPFNVPLDALNTAFLAGLAVAPIPPLAKLTVQGVAALAYGALRMAFLVV